MAWECACGISNHNEAFRCAGCGWSREESQQKIFDVEAKQPEKYINKNGKHKWGWGRHILLDFVGSMIVVGLSQSDSLKPLIILILLFILILVWPSGV
ncbi:MAG TPA: hypothetical protein DCZ97_11920 [Syntrophus sp. (in: bacteria)]|nr:hypothetical protein [Syntrophus sp. (in: bacteria)]